MKAAFVEMMEDNMDVTGQFQLVELEQRLEMAAAADPSKIIIDYCCRCFMNPQCEPAG